MNILLWPSMAGLTITGRTFSFLHLLPVLVGFLSVIYLAWTSAMRGRKISFRNTIKPSESTKPVSPSSKIERVKWTKGIVSGNRPFYFAAIVCGAFILQTRKLNFAPIAEEHNVAVLADLGSDEWRMRSDEEGEFVYRGCPDFENASVIWVGYIADRAKWREYGRCKSIRETGLGFYWREGHNDWRRIQ